MSAGAAPAAPPVVVIVGPTAVGKSALALELAARLDGEIVNADALQVYRGFDIGTGKPTREQRASVPHHLFDIVEPDERFSAGEFARRARRVLGEVRRRGRPALVVGGSGLYLRALMDGLKSLPEVAPAVRERLRQRLETEGLATLRVELEEVDPATAARLEPGDTQRTLRALEVHAATGRPFSAWLDDSEGAPEPIPAVWIGLTVSRSVLYDRIADRVERMLADGWLDEVAGHLAHGRNPSLPPFQALGYRELAACAGGSMSLDEAKQAIVQSTRRFAKRQLTWFRADPRICWFDTGDESCRDAVEAHIGDSAAGPASV